MLVFKTGTIYDAFIMHHMALKVVPVTYWNKDMNFTELFNILDRDNDGVLSRAELHAAARLMGWHWQEAPLFAVLDLLSITNPIPEETFITYLTQIITDPQGVFGEVLLHTPYYSSERAPHLTSNPTHVQPDISNVTRDLPGANGEADIEHNLVSLLEEEVGVERTRDYVKLLDDLKNSELNLGFDEATLLIIDPQRSFTRGDWKHSIGSGSESEVRPIRLAFENCSRMLQEHYHQLEVMFTRCPFPPDSYDWDDTLKRILPEQQLYFIKPGNSVLYPPTNGFQKWVREAMDKGKKTLVMAGCTLNSCVRVSAIETQKAFQDQQLQVVVDLSLCGARLSNYLKKSFIGNRSAVEAAVEEMIAAGVKVVRSINWSRA
ncbi:hypothetical protein ACFL27_06425 [candidate division CSSED10-310 bacterium]|uniref:EF-hand domain-containing protein n=1 Tax=candidate division CSSED10-310 bacterium TaxID=2855610 RepID=A0ABV6YUI2_UNCC1